MGGSSWQLPHPLHTGINRSHRPLDTPWSRRLPPRPAATLTSKVEKTSTDNRDVVRIVSAWVHGLTKPFSEGSRTCTDHPSYFVLCPGWPRGRPPSPRDREAKADWDSLTRAQEAWVLRGSTSLERGVAGTRCIPEPWSDAAL